MVIRIPVVKDYRENLSGISYVKCLALVSKAIACHSECKCKLV